jgi:uncharacterized protein YndB with AHSA1/START domain
VPKNLEATIDINAAPEAVWTVVSNLKRMPEWSPQCRVMQPLGKLKEGTRTININKQGWKYWPTTSKVVRFEPNTAVAFKVVENGSIWSFELAPTAAGTTLTQRRDVTNGTTKVSQLGIGRVLGGEPSFEVELVDGMQSTLAKIKQAVERG